MASPCGLSYSRTLKIIKDSVLDAGYNGRSEVMQGLLKDGFTYSEAKQVTDQYFRVYKRVSDDFKQKKPSVILTSQQKAAKRLNNISVDYLNGNIGGFPMNDADAKHLESIYDKASKADTATLKEKFNEEAAVFVQKFLPKYGDELFKTSVYARPLLSAVFFIKSLTSNLHAQIERGITDTLWDGKKIDFTSLFKFDGLANVSFLNVLKGGVPATSLYQSEQNVGSNKGRLEEYSIKGTDAADTKLKSGYFGVMKYLSKWSNRFNAAPDTRGIFSNAERHFYQLSKEKYRELGRSAEEATELALKDMDLDDKATAEAMAAAKFKEVGLPTTATNGKPSSEFKVAVAEYQRLKRDEVIWGKALQLSKNDFWKRNMTVASELGFGDYGLFGLKVQALSGLRDKMEKHNKNKLTSAFNLYAFGFLNGAANFGEDAIERFPLYALIKVLALQSKKGKVTDVLLQKEISRRQRDMVAKSLITFSFFVAARMAEHLICPDKENKISSADISENRTQIGVCGIPAIVPPQMMVMYKVYKILEQYAKSDEEFFDTALNVLPVLVQSNEIGLGGAVGKIGTGITAYAAEIAKGNPIKADEEFHKIKKNIVRGAADVANSFLPLPSRLMSEQGVAIQKFTGVTQKQQSLPFSIDNNGKPLSMLKSLGDITVATMGNVSGVGEIMIAALGSKKTYAVDWQGRTIAQFRGSDVVGSGIQYAEADDILFGAGVKAPYVNRLQKVDVGKTKKEIKGFSGTTVETTKEVRYLTDDEFFNVSVALGNFNKEYFDKNSVKMIKAIKDNKRDAQDEIRSIFDKTKKKAIEAVQEGKKTEKEILNYVKENWKTEKDRSRTKTTFEKN